MKWTPPVYDGGSPITAYRVVILNKGTEVKNQNVTDPGTTSLLVAGLERDTEYSVKVFARNAVFEGEAAQKTIRTKIEGELIVLYVYSSIRFTLRLLFRAELM